VLESEAELLVNRPGIVVVALDIEPNGEHIA
jgi:hypothetical protein